MIATFSLQFSLVKYSNPRCGQRVIVLPPFECFLLFSRLCAHTRVLFVPWLVSEGKGTKRKASEKKEKEPKAKKAKVDKGKSFCFLFTPC
jgi:hypothetical protein